jgi:hypothetical protein
VALSGVDTVSLTGRSGLPILQFKSREAIWVFGHGRTVPEDGSRWGVNPTTFKRGYVCFGNDNKVLGERLAPISQPMPEFAKLPDMGFPWHEEWAVNLKCINGTDAGTEVRYPATTVGGHQTIGGMIEAVRDQIDGGQHDGRVVPIVHLEKDSYQHAQYSRIWTPVMTIVDWMSLDGPEPAPAPAPVSPSPSTPPTTEQPRRRVTPLRV